MLEVSPYGTVQKQKKSTIPEELLFGTDLNISRDVYRREAVNWVN